MSQSYKLTLLARDDLDAIWDYIAAENLDAANRILDRFHDRFSMLARQPFIGEACDELRPGLRCFPVGNYVIYYTIIKRRVVIARILHGARDVTQLF